ncbi:hypothetical protein AHF37_06456 [Paragonimus kellicotti]|nr:hypothetical protein AHF37_06456 [Paragonimus kellicotti]
MKSIHLQSHKDPDGTISSETKPICAGKRTKKTTKVTVYSRLDGSNGGVVRDKVSTHSKHQADSKIKISSSKWKVSRFHSRHNSDVWFEGVSPALIAASREDQPATSKTLVKPSSFTGPTRRIAIDCEFVGVGYEGKENALARVSIVNQFGHLLLDAYVRPKERVTDYRTPYSGIRPADLRPGGPARSFNDVHREVAKLCKGRILVGHSINNDLKVLMLSHPRRDIRDTSRYRPFRALFSGRTPSLRKLTEKVLGVQVQAGEHDSVEDARATMRLYTSVKRVWESNKKGRVPIGSTRTRNVPDYSCQPSAQPQSDPNGNVVGLNLLSEYEAGIDPVPASMASTHAEQISSFPVISTSWKSSRWDPNRQRRCSKKRTNFLRKRQKRSKRQGSTGFQSARM